MHRLWQQLAIATNWPILVAATLLSTLGVASIWAKNPTEGPKQLVFLAIAIAALIAIQGISYLSIGRYAWGLYILSLLLIGYTLVGGLAENHHHPLPLVHAINKVHCWISFPAFGPIPEFNFEPSELMKVAFVMVLARYLRFRSNYRTFLGLLPPFLLAIVPMLMIINQPSLGVAMLFVPTLMVMLFVAGAKMKHLLAVVAIGMGMAPVFWMCGLPNVPILRHFPTFVHDYQRGYVKGIFSHDPQSLNKSGYQQERALEAEGSGGIVGKGLGQIPVGQGVPEADDDMIFSIIGEQFGLIGSFAVLAAYIVFFTAGVEIAGATREPFGRLVAVGIVCFVASQALLNLMVVMRLFPVTGVPLPFVSYGGSSLLASYIAAGLLLNIGQNRPLVIARNSFEFD